MSCSPGALGLVRVLGPLRGGETPEGKWGSALSQGRHSCSTPRPSLNPPTILSGGAAPLPHSPLNHGGSPRAGRGPRSEFAENPWALTARSGATPSHRARGDSSPASSRPGLRSPALSLAPFPPSRLTQEVRAGCRGGAEVATGLAAGGGGGGHPVSLLSVLTQPRWAVVIGRPCVDTDGVV